MRIIFVFIVSIFFSVNAIASEDIKLKLCANNTLSLTILDITSCNDLLTNNPNWAVKSFSVSFEVNGVEYNYNVEGYNFELQIHQAIESLNPSKISIFNVIVVNATNYERKMEGIEITVIP